MDSRRLTRPLLALLMLVGIAACSSIDCPVQNTVYTVYQLMRPDGTRDTLKTDTLWVWTPRSSDMGDTLLLNRLCGPEATEFSLPISYTQDVDVLVTLLADTLGHYRLDTIRVAKENIAHFESVDCQPAYFHQLTSVTTTHNGIDSVAIHHSYVDYDASTPHLYLYLKADR